jgi:mRNA interferase MazF
MRPGKRRPCVVVQAEAFDLESVLVVPLTSRITREEPFPVRVRVRAGEAGLERESDAMVDQVMAVERRRFRELTGPLPEAIREDLRRALVEFLDL